MKRRKRNDRGTRVAAERGGDSRETIDAESVESAEDRPDPEADARAEKALPPDMIGDGLYCPAGFRCGKCGYRTKKKGFSGRQALRAHLKSHVVERRAWLRPLWRLGLVSGLLIGLIIAGLIGRKPWPATPVLMIVPGWQMLAASLPLLAGLLVVWVHADEFFSRAMACLAKGLVTASSLVGALAAMFAVGIGGAHPGWAFHIPVVAVLLLAAPTAALVGVAEYDAKRGRRRSRKYAAMFLPRNSLAAEMYESWKRWVWEQISRRKTKPVRFGPRGASVYRVKLPKR